VPKLETKICNRSELQSRASNLPKPCVLTNGVFDILHPGHVSYLQQAREQGASLVVGVNTDASVRRLSKGSDRPINACKDRMLILAALESVSLVVEFDEDNALRLVEETLPSLYIKGGDYYCIESTPEGKAVLDHGGRTIIVPFVKNYSTSKIISRVRQVF
jgi:rfaE bifunctional protein nucleotidyltransferase chain/domain